MKKCIFLFIGFLLFANCISFSQIPSYVPTNGLLGYWPFNGNANDESGNGNNGTVNGATLTNDRFGNVGKAYSFNGVSNFIQTNANGITGNSSRSFSFWVKTASSNVQTPIDCFSGSGGGAFQPILNNPCLGLGVDASNGVVVRENLTLINNKWHHCVIVFDSAIDLNISQINFYIDGVLQTSYLCSAVNANAIINTPNVVKYVFGKTISNLRYVLGSLDDIAIYNRALTQLEITSLYNANSCIANITNNDTTICKGSSIILNATAVNPAAVTDINGNVYPSVNIGTQTWMQKNLNVSKYKNGDLIPQVTDSATWRNLSTGAWCWYNNDSTTYAATYGKLYNWYAVNDSRGLAPNGWHVPSDREWNILVKNIDPSTDTSIIGWQNTNAGGMLKSITSWNSPNTGATNSTRFTALPGGGRYDNGTFLDVAGDGIWWSTNENNNSNAFYRYLGYYSANIFRGYNDKKNGSSVRLIQDATYLWSTGATTPSITVTPTVTTKYYCTVSDGVTFCKDSVTVTVSTIATNIITADTVKVCGTSTTITAIAGLSSYSWSNGATTQATTVTSSGWYKCTATNGACSKTDSVYVSLFNPKILQNDTAVCSGTNLTLTVNNNLSSPLNGTLRNGLVGYWPFNGNANDESGNGNNGVVNGATLTTDRFGNGNSAYNFNGTSNNIKIPNTSTLNNTSFSISGWFNNNTNPTNDLNDCKAIITKWWQSPSICNENYNAFNVTITKPFGYSPKLGFATAFYEGNVFFSNSNIGVGEWKQFVYIHDANTGGKLYLNGVLENFNNVSGTTCNSTNPIYIGCDVNGGVLWRFFNGKIDNIAIYNRALSVSEVQQLYTGFSSYLWSTGSTTPSIILTPTTTTSYIATVSNGINTCKDTVKITVIALPTNIITVDTVKACGTSTTITAASGFSSYSWSNGASSQATTVTTSGWYKCSVTNSTGCTAKDSVYVSLFNPKIAQNDTAVCGGSSMTLSLSSVNSAFVTDINGNVYPTVNIGTQTWIQKNLNVSKYKNGDVIPQVTNTAQWAALTTGAWCWYNNDSLNYSKYGKLYNWYVVNDPRGLAPEGWHVPTDGEWNKLVKYLDESADTSCTISPCSQSNIAGGSLKETGLSNWNSPNSGATNISNFTALPSGYRYSYGTFFNAGGGLNWWSSDCFNRYLGYDIGNIYRGFGQNQKSAGFSVRAIRNTPTYLWSTGATTPSIIVTPTTTTSYIATVSNGINTCKDTVKIIVNALPTNIITVDTVKACGTSTTITAASGFSSYSWSNGATTQATIVTTSRWYKCTVTNATGCTSKDSVYVSLFNPKILQNDTAVCGGISLVLNINVPNSSSMTDINGNVYSAINIGTQTWTQKNLNVSRYRNGDIIPQVINATQWANLTTGAWCWYNNDSLNYSKYGKLYNWYAVNDSRGLAPDGWSVPTYSQLTTLSTFLGGTSVAGGKLKESTFNYWNSPNTGATNSSGFSALGSGLINYFGNFEGLIKIDAGFWSNVEPTLNSTYGIGMTLKYNSASVVFAGYGKGTGYSIRLIKNIPQTYLWSTGATTQSITVTPTATTSYIATVSNGINTCKDTVKISIQSTPATPAAIQKEFSPVSVAAVTNVSGLNTETYRIKKVANAVSYDWSLKRGTLASITHLNPLGVNDTAVTVTFNSCFLRDTLCVKSVGICSSSVAKALVLYANTTPASIAAITTPGGNFAVCTGTTKSFTAYPATPTTTQTAIGKYRWSLPANAVIVSANADSSSINVQFNSGFVSGNISVKGVNACTGAVGASSSVTLQYLPPTPYSISSSTGSYNACINSTVTFTAMISAPTSSQTVASIFRWTKPNYTTIISAAPDSSSITLRFNTGYTGGIISVKGQTICGAQGTAKSQSLTHTGCAIGTKQITDFAKSNNPISDFSIQLFPNPTSKEFNLKVNSNINLPVIVKVIDAQGRMMKAFEVKSNSVQAIGNELSSGIYFIDATQGEIRKTIRAVKY
jgi:uncharacterized protein (TIGR02145 family)